MSLKVEGNSSDSAANSNPSNGASYGIIEDPEKKVLT